MLPEVFEMPSRTEEEKVRFASGARFLPKLSLLND